MIVVSFEGLLADWSRILVKNRNKTAMIYVAVCMTGFRRDRDDSRDARTKKRNK